jgi:hypothetical protein
MSIFSLQVDGNSAVMENYLLTRHLRKYLPLVVVIVRGAGERIGL